MIVPFDDMCTTDFSTMQGHPLLRPPPNPFIQGIIEGFYGTPWSAGQRRELMRILAREGLNTYVYAPKDDPKHRKEWREKYGTEEAAELQTLIEFAKSLGIDFVYALSPGNDIEYSNAKDVTAVKSKLGQLKSIGCEGFALLFDDIEYKLRDADETQFGTPANAQVAVVNDCYTTLNCPSHFYFCPTEYCSTRAKPNLLESDYLRTIGDRLHPGIEIFWTGPLVVPATISEANSRAIGMVLKRKPLIWDNLYANDYDTKRVFLGPFKGRGQSLKKECAGILLNPNCQFEMNLPAIFSFSDWSKASDDPLELEEDAMIADDQPLNRFIPSSSFEKSMGRWMKELVLPFIPMRIHMSEVLDFSSSGGSLLTNISTSDYAHSEGTTMVLEEQRSIEEPMERSPSCDSDISMGDSGKYTGTPEGVTFTSQQVSALAHCYYLPFEYGPIALDILNGTLWLYRHANVMAADYVEEVRKRSVSSSPASGEKKKEELARTREEWIKTHRKVSEGFELIAGAFRVLGSNKVHNPDLAQYASDVYSMLVVITAVLDWLKEGNLSELTDPRERRWSSPLNAEPWHVCSAFVDDIAYAILPPSHPYSLIFGHRDTKPISTMMTIRGFRRSDAPLLSSFSRTFPEEDLDLPLSTDHYLERYYTPYLEWSEKHCIIAEENTRYARTALGSICGILDIVEYYEHREKVEANRMEGEEESSFSRCLPPLPTDSTLVHFRSFLDIRQRDPADIHVAKRLIQMVAVIMAYEGSTGVYTACSPTEREKVDILLTLGFVELSSIHTDQILLGLRIVSPEISWSEDEDEEKLLEDIEREIQESNVEDRGDKDDV